VHQPLTSDIPLLAAAPKAVIRTIRVGELRRGAVLFAAGGTPSGIHIIVSGVVKVYLPLADRGEKVIALPSAGESLGTAALLLGKRHLVGAVAATDCRVIHLPRAAVLRAMRQEPKFANEVALDLSRRFHALVADLQTTARHSAFEKTAMFLLSQLPRSGGKRAVSTRLPARKADIASKLDLTGAHFSRVLRELHASGLVVLNGSTVTVRDVQKLRDSIPRRRARRAARP
jgi:CRP/FNR family transcriptional regulator, dissimilatory nitrate respiration regulator